MKNKVKTDIRVNKDIMITKYKWIDDCNKCKGEGFICNDSNKIKCDICKGFGYVKHSEVIAYYLPE